MTAFASVQSAVEAIREGAFDYLPKPFDPDEALLKVERAAERKALRDRAAGLERDLQQVLHMLGRSRFGDLMGRSEAMQRVFREDGLGPGEWREVSPPPGSRESR